MTTTRTHRRRFLQYAASAAAMTLVPRGLFADDAPTASGLELAKFPEKTDLLLLTDRPPQLETPLKYFQTDLTPSEAMFVRWHLAGIPTSIDLGAFRLNVGGQVDKPLSLSLADLESFEQASVVAVNQCSGNSRSFFAPRVPGGQWGNGAMGNARWTGVRLADVLARAGVKPGAIEVSFQGLDRPVIPATPAFIKTLPIERAKQPDILIAYAMNGQPLPLLNGAPLRLVVPGWFATYWVKSLNEINVLGEKFKGFWMDKAYRVPDNPRMEESPRELAKVTVPISKMPVRSIFVSPGPGEAIKAGVETTLSGVAFDGGSGVRQVEVSTDAGKTWQPATLGQDLGNFSWRRWTLPWKPAAGRYELAVRATSNAGETQSPDPIWNRSGYARNVIEKLSVVVS